MSNTGLTSSRLSGRAALVTGGSRGIGRAVVRRLAADGADVVFTYATEAAAAAQVMVEVAADGGHAFAVAADLGLTGDVQRLFSTAVDHVMERGHRGLDILVSNGGIMSTTPVADTTESEYDRVMAVKPRVRFS